ncbi:MULTISPECIES: hypothetical protein [Labrys]|uniref:Transposase n=1 Tax=Labrys neptuniae TaxID=376174 RepID=A0ABV3PVM5_9HYPH
MAITVYSRPNKVDDLVTKSRRYCLKNDAFQSAASLHVAIKHFISEHSQPSQPFVWRSDPERLIAAGRSGGKCRNQSGR